MFHLTPIINSEKAEIRCEIKTDSTSVEIILTPIVSLFIYFVPDVYCANCAKLSIIADILCVLRKNRSIDVKIAHWEPTVSNTVQVIVP